MRAEGNAGERGRLQKEFPELTGFSVLIVDDDEAIHALCRSIISRYVTDAVVLSAEDGVDAIAQARAHKPDVILMDIAMPGLDGLAATRVLKAAPETAKIPIIAFTGRVWNTEDFLEADCAALLSKPCSPRRMLATIADVVSRQGSSRG